MFFFIKKYLCLFIITLILSLKINAQQSNVLDSLTKKSFQELTDLFYASKPDIAKAIQYANANYLKAIQEKDTMEMINSKYILADIKNNSNIFLNFCDSLIEVYSKEPTKNFPSAIYLRKGKYYFHNKKNSDALNQFSLVSKQLKINKNDSLKTVNYLFLGLMKSVIKKNKESFYYLKKSYSLFNKNKNYQSNKDLISLPINIAIRYNKLNMFDSASYYNKKGIKLYKNLKDEEYLGSSYYIKGMIEFNQKKLKKSIKSIQKSIPSFISDENFPLLISSYSKIARCYELSNKDLACKHHLKVDSIYNKTRIKNFNIKYSFLFLINYYKQTNNIEKQLVYINKLLEIKEFELTEKNKINKTFTEEYDIPNLLAEKKKIILELENNVKRSNQNIIIAILIIFASIILVFYQIRKKKVYKKRFLAIVNQENFINPKLSSKEKTTANKPKLSNSIVTAILKELDTFEKEEVYLQSDNSLQNLANKLNTNANYLSKVINQHKNTTFSNYINKLRIEYAVKRLKKDPLWRKYTIKAIATEVGFKNAESFSKAFVKFTELKPSYFIKNLEK
ncbi:helix-turn-helix domain-containing protein [Tenacibaculum sp. nBUS_03]|uniref:helix-turn-helix domain-containing protein n=1 Tax=Tenacibaculum sp. nBUS_03 TaxID=3395320 RepID=UPI003EB70902